MKVLSICILLASAAALWSGCETTGRGYGYMATGLNEESIVDLFAVADEAVNAKDYETYTSLLGPGFSTTDKSDKYGGYNSMSNVLNLSEYLSVVRDVFRDARYIDFHTSIMTIEMDEVEQIAMVKVREEQELHYQGRERSTISLVEYEIGYEDGWVFFKRAETTARQDIRG